jgi:hypothetical protein
MPLPISDFTTHLDAHLNRILSGASGTNSAEVFLSSTVYSPTCWAAHLPLEQIAWYDTAGFSGRGIAITPRHVLVTEHGREPDTPPHRLMWIYRDGTPIEIPVVGSVRSIFDNAIAGIQTGSVGAFMLIYMASDVPLELLGRLIAPNELPSELWHEGTLSTRVPLLVVNQDLHANIWELNSIDVRPPNTNTYGPSDNSSLRGLAYQSTMPQRAQFWQEARGGDSGSPMFLVVRNQHLCYYGHATSAPPDGGPWMQFPIYASAYVQIMKACDQLNERYAGPNVQWYKPASGSLVGGRERGNYAPPASGPLGP